MTGTAEPDQQEGDREQDRYQDRSHPERRDEHRQAGAEEDNRHVGGGCGDRSHRGEGRPKPSAPVGYVSFVGSGPGDPGLLTVRAVDLLREAEVVVTEVPRTPLVRTLLGACSGGRRRGGNQGAGRRPEFVDGGFGRTASR